MRWRSACGLVRERNQLMAGTTETYQQTAAQRWHELVDLHAPLVKRIAHHLRARLPASVQVEDLVQAGMLGLLEAARKFEDNRGASFETYAGIRIRGAMLDEIRRGDWAPRSVHRNARRVSDAIAVLERRLGREARDHEIAAALQMDLDAYHELLQDALGCRLFSYEDLLEQGEQRDLPVESKERGPYEGLEKSRFLDRLGDAIAKLSAREQLVLSLYYDDELNLKEIGAVLGVTEARVSQIHTQAAARLRARLVAWRSGE